MVHWMRKYRRYIFLAIAIITIPTFIYWGGSRGGGRNKAQQENDARMMAPVAVVAGTPITRAEYQRRLYAEADKRARYGGERPKIEDMAQDGTAEQVLDSIIDARLVDMEAQKVKVNVSREYLIEQLKKQPQFKDEQGNFSPAIWNQWIKSEVNWNEVYAELQAEMARSLVIRQAMAPARVMDSEIRDQFAASKTKIQVKYVLIDPPIVPTEDQIKAQYDKNQAKYDIPEKRSIEFVQFSLRPPVSADVSDVLTRARNGEDFGELAKANSKLPDADKGGDMGWVKDEGQEDPDSPLFKTAVGQISEPFYMQGGYFVYKVSEERTEPDGKRSVKAQQIGMPVMLDEAQVKALTEKANALAEKADTSKDFKAAAAEAGVEVKTASEVSTKTDTIEGVPEGEVFQLRTAVSKLGQGEFSEVIQAKANIYLAKVTEVAPSVPQPLETVRDQVTTDAANSMRYSQSHKAEMKALGDKILAETKSLQEVVDKHPEYALQIKESPEFNKDQNLMQDGLYLYGSQVFDLVEDKEPGVFCGPLVSLRSEVYFFELEKKTPPTDEMWAKDWPQEEKKLREQALQMKQNQMMMDYIKDLREKADRANLIQRDTTVLTEMLAPRPEPADADAEAAPESADNSAAGADEAAADKAPATEGATDAAPAAAEAPQAGQ